MKEISVMDSRGRVTVGLKLGKKFGRKFFVVPMPNEIALIPVPEDPVKNLQEMWEKAGLNKYTRKQLRNMAEKEAEKEALEGWRKSQRRIRR
ncbi:MAG: hypothetical protein KGI04_04000 [Candidatus Micrarchaeota archaeon]|nr:hypothetical protein [Candidatus Micrarchaeota archaeon]